MNTASRKLGQLLVDRRLLTKDNLELNLRLEAETGVPLAKLLIEGGQVREEDLLRVVAERVGLDFVELDDVLLQPEAVSRLSAGQCRELTAIPVRIEDGAVVVAVADPFDQANVQALEEAMGAKASLALATKEAIRRAVDFVHGPDRAAEEGPEPGGELATVTPLRAAGTLAGVHVNDLLEILLDRGGSDLHLTVGTPPQIRVTGSLVALEEFGELRPAELRGMLYEILTDKQRDALEENLELDTSHPLPGRGRFRVNVFFQRDSIGAVMRAIPQQIKSLTELHIPPVVAEFADYPRGLVLVTGPTGSGKSTTLAAIIDLINQRRAVHILTVEDPIEFVHRHKRSVVNQREVGTDTMGFAEALKHALRQDPDVILVGEMRDLETIATALTAAETGHLVFATLHTQDAAQSMDRIIDVFPSYQQQQVRIQLSSTIQAVMTQQLLASRDGKGRTPACEVMVATPGIRNLIREGKVHQITSAMQAGGKYGMQTMDQALAGLVKAGKVSFEAALERCSNLEEFQRLAGRVA
ncbi:MAG: PilT/PilU family type 4a pilus ATPase [Acidimicrobiia bacterium]